MKILFEIGSFKLYSFNQSNHCVITLLKKNNNIEMDIKMIPFLQKGYYNDSPSFSFMTSNLFRSFNSITYHK